MKQNFTVRQGALDGVEAFLSVARHKSFRRAAADLGVTPSAISQAVRVLEARIGAPLFTRTTRSVGLTEAGGRFLARAGPAFEELVAAGETARDLGRRPSGLLRLAVPRAVVPLILQPMIASFCAAYPDVELEIAASEELVDIAEQGFDAGIRLGQFIAADMTAVRLTPPFRFVVVGSPDYLARAGAPKRPEGLRGHACLRQRRSNGAIALWRFIDGNRPLEVSVAGPLIANDFPTLLAAALEGVGLAQIPEPVAKAALGEHRLRHVLAAFAPTTPGIFLFHSGRREVLPKLRAFIEHAKSLSTTAKGTRIA
ncbi:MAG: LysR family transcriptional regulator [Alphaproteobacteria bacterium]|nr:MAG: LysR family transcriptional regulator [Alphaproteobacteria bacterium]